MITRLFRAPFPVLFIVFLLFPLLWAQANSIWDIDDVPVSNDVSDGSALELGTKFVADRDGYIVALRFYKSSSSTGGEVGRLWSGAGT